jgi:hypothetical protein
MSKMTLHEPFGHLQHKLWSKEGLRVKLAIWLSTTKSWESTWSRCVQVECNTLWKSLKENYKFALDLIPIKGWGKKLWMPKVPEVQIGTILGLHFGSFGKKCHSDASATERYRKYYMGDTTFPRVRAVVNQVSPRLPVACPNTKSVQNEF